MCYLVSLQVKEDPSIASTINHKSAPSQTTTDDIVVVMYYCYGPLGAISVSEVPKMMTDQQRTIIMPESDLTDSAPSLLQQQYRRSRSHTGNRTVDVQQQARGVRSQSAKLGNRRITIDNSDMYNSAGDFATSVFTELPEDLQEILSPSLGGKQLVGELVIYFYYCVLKFEEEEPHTNQLMRLAVEGGNDKELLQLLKQHGLVSDPVNDDGSTLLHVAAIKGQLSERTCINIIPTPLHVIILYC